MALKDEIKVATKALDAARLAAIKIAAGETAALSTSTAYSDWSFSKKRADHEVIRLEGEVARLNSEIEQEKLNQQRAAIQERRDACAARYDELKLRVEHFRDNSWPVIRELLVDLASHEIERGEINAIVQPAQQIGSPDLDVRSRHSISESVIEEEQVILWCLPYLMSPYGDQSAIGPNGRFISGRSLAAFVKRPLNRKTIYRFTAARSALPLWSMMMPSLDGMAGPQFNGGTFMPPQSVIETLRAPRREPPRDIEVKFLPLFSIDEVEEAPIDIGPVLSS